MGGDWERGGVDQSSRRQESGKSERPILFLVRIFFQKHCGQLITYILYRIYLKNTKKNAFSFTSGNETLDPVDLVN